LIAASVISAPAALLMAKMLEPELGRPRTAGKVEWAAPREAVNVVHAVANGAADGVKLAINAAAMLIAFLALIALANALLGWMGQWFDQQWSIEGMFGRVFAPLAWVMGVEWSDSYHVGVLIGKKIAANEFVAYQELAVWLQPDSPVRLTERSVVIATYALCGFANFGSIGIQIGGLGALAPHRQADLARLGVRAMIGGALASFMTACIAGMLV
jgi:CNT family concentrative nucleoside transporter